MNGPRMDIFYDKMGFSFSYDDIQEEIFLNICLFTVKNEKGRTMCKICSKLKKPERRQLYVPRKLFFSHRCIENNFINGKPIRAYRHVQYLPSLETLLMIQKTMTEKTYAVNYRCCMYKKKEYCQI